MATTPAPPIAHLAPRQKPLAGSGSCPAQQTTSHDPVSVAKDPQPSVDASASSPSAVSTLTPSSLPLSSLSSVDKMAKSPSTTAISGGPKVSMTSREWVIPPRPKPGRKPATDTPPTKRKAQNRAAQRAFRERRAARVGELEQQLDDRREAHEKREAELGDKVHNLELDLHSFRSRCLLLESMLERERQDRIRAETQIEILRRTSCNGQGGCTASNSSPLHRFFHQQTDASATYQPPSPAAPPSTSATGSGRSGPGRTLAISHIITPPEAIEQPILRNDPDDVPLTCGTCPPAGPCACAEEALAATPVGCGKCASFGTPCHCLDDLTSVAIGRLTDGKKRPPSPFSAEATSSSTTASSSKSKRSRSDPPATAAEAELTAIFSAAPPSESAPSRHHQPAPSQGQLPFRDSCGFCKEGTYCVCAEDAAMATPAMTPTADASGTPSRQTQTPPPSEPDLVHPPLAAMEMTADGAVKLPRRKRPNGSTSKAEARNCCASGPGTCAQCRADPKSGLFCRLMAAKIEREQTSSGMAATGCCGGRPGAGGGCCKKADADGHSTEKRITLPSLPSLGLSCAEAYQTLSSHRNFVRAADDIGSWLPKLKATAQGAPHGGSRHAIEVEAASIMSVLKEFDVRFGREC